MLDSSILIFTKIPFLADCKTRLQKTGNFDKNKTNLLATAFLLDSIALCKSLSPTKIYLASSPRVDKNELLEILGKIPQHQKIGKDFLEEIEIFPQLDLDFYHRLERAKNYCLKDKLTNLIIIGSDSPQINSDIFFDSVEIMKKNKFSIGETFDGGFYLLGLPQVLAKSLDLSILHSQSQNSDFLKLIEVIGRSNCEVIKQKLRDIDDHCDLMQLAERYKNLLQQFSKL